MRNLTIVAALTHLLSGASCEATPTTNTAHTPSRGGFASSAGSGPTLPAVPPIAPSATPSGASKKPSPAFAFPSSLWGQWSVSGYQAYGGHGTDTPQKLDAATGKVVAFKPESFEYGGAFLWSTKRCDHAAYRLRRIPNRLPEGDVTAATTTSFYGLAPERAFVDEVQVSCGGEGPSFFFEALSADRLVILWDGFFVFLDRAAPPLP